MSTNKIKAIDVEENFLENIGALSKNLVGVLQNWNKKQSFPFLGLIENIDTLDNKLTELGEGTIYSCKWILNGGNYLIIGYIHAYSQGYGAQIKIGYNTNVLAVRRLENGVWSNWFEFLPLTGGTLEKGSDFYLNGGNSRIQTNDNGLWIHNSNQSTNNETNRRGLGIYNKSYMDDIRKALQFFDGGYGYAIHGEYNKPSGGYSGNSDATKRTIAIGGIGKLLFIYNNAYLDSALIGPWGGVAWNYTGTSVRVIKSSEGRLDENNNLIIQSTDPALNKTNAYHYYQLL